MNDERRSKHDGKRRKRSKRSIKDPEIAKKFNDGNPGHQQKDHVGGVTQDRLTCKSGIYTIGKMSIPIHRGVKLSDEIAQAKANQDLKKILNLANENTAIQLSSVAESPIIVEANIEKRKSVFTTPRSHQSVVKSMSSRSAELSTQLSSDTDMQSPLGEEAPSLISRFLKTKQKEIFPAKNYLEEALGDLRQRYKHMITQNNVSVDFHAQQQAYANIAVTMQNTAPKMQSDDNLVEMPHVSPKLVNRAENIILDIFASPKYENVKDCFVNSPNQPKYYTSLDIKQPVPTNLKCPPQPGYFLSVKNECSTLYKPSPKCSWMEWDSNMMFHESIPEKGKRIRLEPSPTFSPNLRSEESPVDATRVFQSSPSDISIWAPSEVSSQNLPVFEPTPSPRFYRYKLC